MHFRPNPETRVPPFVEWSDPCFRVWAETHWNSRNQKVLSLVGAHRRYAEESGIYYDPTSLFQETALGRNSQV